MVRAASLILLVSAGPLFAAAQSCRGKTWEEKVKEIRTAEGCADAAPTDCACEGNKQKTVYDCPAKATTLWESDGKKCVKAWPDKDGDWNRHDNGWDYPETYGLACGVHTEMGSYDCTKVADKTHAFDTASDGYNAKADSSGWCVENWCYVNPCECNKQFASSSWFAPKYGGETTDGKGLYYSYGQCGGADMFTEKACTDTKTQDDCIADADCAWDAGKDPCYAACPGADTMFNGACYSDIKETIIPGGGENTGTAACQKVFCETVGCIIENEEGACANFLQTLVNVFDYSTQKRGKQAYDGLCTGEAVAGSCRSATWDEKATEIRTAEGCADAAPTDCACEGNKQKTVYDCPAKATTLWESDGKKCVKAFPDKDATWARHANGWDYPETYGKECGVQPEPGSYDCTKVADKTHAFDLASDGYNAKTDSSGWCTEVWCYVNPCECGGQQFASSSWFAPKYGGDGTTDGKSLYYSYGKCGGADMFTEKDCKENFRKDLCATDADCRWEKKKPNLVELAVSDSQFSTLVAAVKKAGLVDALSDEKAEFTIMAPNNDAFAAAFKALGITPEEALANPALGDILKYHAVSGKVMAADVKDGMEVTTVQGEYFTVRMEDGAAMIQGGDILPKAKVIATDIEASNGVVHVIDMVLIPPTISEALAAMMKKEGGEEKKPKPGCEPEDHEGHDHDEEAPKMDTSPEAMEAMQKCAETCKMGRRRLSGAEVPAFLKSMRKQAARRLDGHEGSGTAAMKQMCTYMDCLKGEESCKSTMAMMPTGEQGDMMDCMCSGDVLAVMEEGEAATKGQPEDQACADIPQAAKDAMVKMVDTLDANAKCAGLKKQMMCSMSEEDEKCLTDEIAAVAAKKADDATAADFAAKTATFSVLALLAAFAGLQL